MTRNDFKTVPEGYSWAEIQGYGRRIVEVKNEQIWHWGTAAPLCPDVVPLQRPLLDESRWMTMLDALTLAYEQGKKVWPVRWTKEGYWGYLTWGDNVQGSPGGSMRIEGCDPHRPEWDARRPEPEDCFGEWEVMER